MPFHGFPAFSQGSGLIAKALLHVLVMAKSPAPGRVKTRLCPPLSEDQAAALAVAALADTLGSVAACGADRRLLALEGDPGDWIPPGFEVLRQRGATFADRLANAWLDAAGPGLQIGMDTPQATPAMLDECLEATCRPGTTASLGRALDGGWWALGLAARPRGDLFSRVPMSTGDTGRAQLARLRALGHRVVILPTLRDVDCYDDALEVAASAPGSRFAAALRSIAVPSRSLELASEP